MTDTYSVSQTARIIGISPNTVRSWTGHFDEFLSASARPESGHERRYTDDDAELFQTVKILRDQGHPMKQIRPIIESGERYEPILESTMALETGTQASKSKRDATTAQVLGLLKHFTARYESRIDDLELQLKAERDARISAEKEVARLEGMVDELERQPLRVYKVRKIGSFWDRLLGR